MLKCLFCATEVDYLGHVLTAEGIRMDPKKVDIILAWPTPTSVTELKHFLGLLGYYDDFINHYADVAFPLTELFKKSVPWVWGEAQAGAFQQLKALVTSPPCLLMPDLNLPFVIHCDASGYAIGAVLQQDQNKGLQPIAFLSRKLQPPERNLAPYDRELLALVLCLVILETPHLRGKTDCAHRSACIEVPFDCPYQDQQAGTLASGNYVLHA
jgi:hypothetical protein